MSRTRELVKRANYQKRLVKWAKKHDESTMLRSRAAKGALFGGAAGLVVSRKPLLGSALGLIGGALAGVLSHYAYPDNMQG